MFYAIPNIVESGVKHNNPKCMSSYCLALNEQCFSTIMTRTSCIRWNHDDVRFVQDQHAELDLTESTVCG